jgi:catalase
MRVDGNYGSTKGYEPNSWGEWKESPHTKEPPLPIHGDAYNYNEWDYDDDYYTQPGNLFRLMPPDEQELLFANTARAMGDAELFIKQRHVRNCYRADSNYGEGVARALGISLEEAMKEDNN